MKGIQAVGLHPENLIAGRRYRFSAIGAVNRSLTIIQEGTFVKLLSIPRELPDNSTRYILGVAFKFDGKGPPTVIEWYRIRQIDLLEMKPRGD